MQQLSGSATMVETAAAPGVLRTLSHSGQIPVDTTANSTNGHKSIPSPVAQSVEPSAVKHLADSNSSSDSRAISPTDQDSDDNTEIAGDLQFKKKNFHKSRTQLFQSVLSSASLKSLKHQFTTVPTQPQLKRNPSTISQSNTRNFQSFIQAPVLLLVSNLRTADDVEIGQRLPFDQSLRTIGLDTLDTRSRRSLIIDPAAANSTTGSGGVGGETGSTNAPVDEDDNNNSGSSEDEDEDIYKEETTLQQQRLTLNALKKLSLSLAPIIRDDDDQGPQSRQLTTKLLNSARQVNRPEKKPLRDLRPVLRSAGLRRSKPYQPAEVDLSSFSSLTRQSKHNSEATVPPPPQAATAGSSMSLALDSRQRPESQIMRPSQAQVERASHSQLQAQPQTQAELLSQARLQPQNQIQSQFQGPAELSSLNSTGMRNMSSERGVNFNAGVQKTLQLPPKSDKDTSDGLQKAFNSLVTVPANILVNTPAGPHVLSPRKSQNLMRPAQISTNLNQRDLNTRGQGQGSEFLQGSSLSSSKLHSSDKRLQQINGFRSPMYIPAVLRKTVDETLGFGDADVHAENHGDHNEAQNKDIGSSATSIKSVDLAYSLDQGTSPRIMTGPYELNKRQYDHILRAAPTRRHWLKDETVIECGIDLCNKKFNFFERRHHCRKCGGIFCKEHTSHYLYINHLAQFTTGGRGTLSRVCDNCIKEYNEFMKHEFGVTCHKPLSRESLPHQSTLNKIDYRKEIFTSKMSGNIPMKLSDVSDENKTADQLVGSVPVNWSWSSF